MDFLIQQYLKLNNLTGINGIDYSLIDDGKGPYIKIWKFKIAKPTITAADITLLEAKNARIATRLDYLQSTDWQATAFIKYQRPIDSTVSAKCKQANTEIDAIQKATLLSDVLKFTLTF